MEQFQIETAQNISISQNTAHLGDRMLFFNDLRFGPISLDPNESQFAFSYKLEEDGGKVKVEEMPKMRGDAKKLLRELWLRMWGN